MSASLNDVPLVIYHANCADGFGGAYCFWKFAKENNLQVDFHEGRYNRNPPDVTNRRVFLVDFSYKRKVIEEMLEIASHITIIDHHKSAIEDLNGLSHPKFVKVFDLTKSGAGLAWDYLFIGQPRPKLLDHIEDRDLWRFAIPHTKEIQAALFAEDYDFEKWDELISGGDISLLRMTAAGMAISKKHSRDVKLLVDICTRPMVIGGYMVPAASIPFMFASEAGHIMAENNPFAACYYDTNNYREFSLRSARDGIDVSKIAALYGGGGHFHASGFKVPRDHELAKS